MIRRSYSSDKWMLTQQSEHARLAGLIASQWIFPGDRPSEEALTAISRHDDGWKPVDENARINKAGEPMNFDEMIATELVDIWSRSSKELESEGKFYAARLIAGHFIWHAENSIDLARLSPRGAVGLGKFIAAQRRQMEAWEPKGVGNGRPKTGSDVKTEESERRSGVNYDSDLRLLQVCDQLSLCLCTEFRGEKVIEKVPFLEKGSQLRVLRKGDGLALTITPFPLKVKVRDHLSSVLVPKQTYDNDQQLQKIVAETKPFIGEVHFGG